MKVLITGASGQLGRALITAAPTDMDIRATTHDELDISEPDTVTKQVTDFSPDWIINAAAYTAVDKAESEPDFAYRANGLGAENLADAAAANGARMIQVSTDFVFDGESSAPYTPDSAPSPLGVYGATKLAGERAVLNKLTQGAVVLRTAWVYSARGHNFLSTMLRLMRERGSVRVVADQIGTPTSAPSIADAIWALTRIEDLSGVFHWTDSGVATWYDFAVAISEESSACGLLAEPAEVIPISTQDYPTPARRPRFSVLDKSTTVDVIGITPPHWRASLRRVLGELKLG